MYSTQVARPSRGPHRTFTRPLGHMHNHQVVYLPTSFWTSTSRPFPKDGKDFWGWGLPVGTPLVDCRLYLNFHISNHFLSVYFFSLLWPFEKLACPAHCPPVFCEDRVTATTQHTCFQYSTSLRSQTYWLMRTCGNPDCGC